MLQTKRNVLFIAGLAMFLQVFFHSPFSSNAEKSFNLLKESESSVLSNNLDSFKIASPNEQDFIQINQETEIDIKENSIPIDNYLITPQSNYLVHDDRFIFNSSLTENDPDDMFFFQVESDRTIITDLISDNSEYLVQLYMVDWENGVAYETNLKEKANNRIVYNKLPEGDWALRITSTKQIGDDYTIKMNASNPSGASFIYAATPSIQHILLGYPNNDIFANGNFILNTEKVNSHLNWEREFYFGWDGNYNRRKHSISHVHYSSISTPVSYQSSYASSDNAVLIYLKQETLFTYFESYFRSDPPTQYEQSFIDTIGKKTPRRLDEDDLMNWGDHILIYDLDNQETIDFFSILNYYYASGTEAIPTITFLD